MEEERHSQQQQQQQQQKPQSLALEDCLKLLRGERDEQRLAGLLLVTKVCEKDDHDSIRRVYDAVGVRFLDRLLRTGMGTGNVTGGSNDNDDVYLQLSVSILAAFCRVPQIAAADEMVAKIPLILQIMEKQSSSNVLEECFEILLLVSMSHKDGVTAFLESGGLKVLASHLRSMTDGSQNFELSIRLLQLICVKISPDIAVKEYLTELSIMVSSIAQKFAALQNAIKFELLHILSVVLSWHQLVVTLFLSFLVVMVVVGVSSLLLTELAETLVKKGSGSILPLPLFALSKGSKVPEELTLDDLSGPLGDALRAMSNDEWSTCIQAGIMDILQSRVAADQKLQALVVAQSMVSILGEGWLIGQVNLHDARSSIPSDRCLLLILELSRVEVAILLNDLGYLKYGASSSMIGEISQKQAKLSIAFYLLEKIIKLISEVGEDEGNVISEGSITKVILGLNETSGVVLEYLNDAKDHGQRKGDDLLASVRFVGSYLAETPLAWKEKVEELLGYMLSVEGEHEPRF
ncbi:hypothetical protein Dimus_021315 [Dionaea muscipula]